MYLVFNFVREGLVFKEEQETEEEERIKLQQKHRWDWCEIWAGLKVICILNSPSLLIYHLRKDRFSERWGTAKCPPHLVLCPHVCWSWHTLCWAQQLVQACCVTSQIRLVFTNGISRCLNGLEVSAVLGSTHRNAYHVQTFTRSVPVRLLSGCMRAACELATFETRFSATQNFHTNAGLMTLLISKISSVFSDPSERTKVTGCCRVAAQQLNVIWYVGQGCFSNPPLPKLCVQTTMTSWPMRRCPSTTSLLIASAP